MSREVTLLEPNKGDDKHPPFVTVYKPVRGWCAMMVEWDEEVEDYLPWQTGLFSYSTKEEAMRDAKAWAKAEGIPFFPDTTPRRCK